MSVPATRLCQSLVGLVACRACMHVAITESVINFVTNFDQSRFPKVQKEIESCRSAAVASTQQLQPLGALLEHCSGQEGR